MAGKLFVLLPPSEAKMPGGSRVAKKGSFDDELAGARLVALDSLLRDLDSAPTKRRELLLNARGPLMERAIEATKELAAGSARLLPAWKRYSGVVWSHLDPATIALPVRRRILIPSAIYGITTGEDPIADFRLKMNIGVGSLGTMATYWRAHLTSVLSAHTRRATVVNLLPKEHGSAIDFDALRATCTVITVAFIDESRGVIVGHDAKATKGVLARRLLDEGVESLSSFEWRGWRADVRDGLVHVVAPSLPFKAVRKREQLSDTTRDLGPHFVNDASRFDDGRLGK
ncbi:MAG: peroxide stress protein YaaA [Acidimicrobiales bacterium]